MLRFGRLFFAVAVGTSFLKICESVSEPVGAITVSTSEDSNTNAIEGFGTDLQCLVNTCINHPSQKVNWYKDDVPISNGLNALLPRMSIKHNVVLDPNKDCTGHCSRAQACPAHQYCLEPSCCQCTGEEFTLIITNLSLTDSGKYKCRLEPDGSAVEVRLTVMEGGTFPSFNRNLTFDHSECCEAQRMSFGCMPMCKPSILETHKFDPVPCQKEFSKLLNCATVGGNVSHVHCCRLSFVPPFCWEYCSGRTTDFQKSNKLCVYWMPEIFQCYEQAFLPYPGPPEQLVVNTVNSTTMEACWDEPKVRGNTIKFYSVRYQELPRFPFLGGTAPFLTGDGDEPTDGEIEELPIDEEIPGKFGPLLFPTTAPTTRFHKTAHGRKRRQSLIISTHNFATNETEIREFKYMETNTTSTCEILTNLKPSTQYFVYVTATNSYGTSLPSLRQTAVTDVAFYPNHTLPNVKDCCISRNVESDCVAKMCDLESPPSSVGAFNLAFTCRKDFAKVTPCLADGRDHTECCKEKRVGGDCLKLCDGTASNLAMTSVLCLSFDLQSIYSCYREGYIALPSPPINLTVVVSDATTADIRWDPPSINADKVSNYSLFYKVNKAEQYFEIKDVQSPYSLLKLQPDSTYNVYVIARGRQGSSLKSTVVRFVTSDRELENVCQYGKPLRNSFDQPVLCGARVPCPLLYKCVDSGSDDSDKMFCCPTNFRPVTPPDLNACCVSQNVPPDCMNLCSYNLTNQDILLAGPVCASHLKALVQCGIDGRNDRPCCLKAGVPDGLCLDFCQTPNDEFSHDHLSCSPHANKIIKCALEGVLTLPGQPLELRLEDSGSSYALLTWSRPKQLIPVEKYEIRVFSAKRQMSISLNTSGLSLTIPDLTSDDGPYVAQVVASNVHGSSMPGNNLTFNVGERGTFNPDDDFKPRPPYGVEKLWYKKSSANITWMWDNVSVTGKKIDGIGFRVAYKQHIADKQTMLRWKNVTVNDKFALLTNLTPSATYDIQVFAVHSLKKIESSPSETINVLTQEVRVPPTIEIRGEPSSGVKSGDIVTVFCMARGDPEPNVALEKGGKLLTSGSKSISFVFVNVKPEDFVDPIVCVANNGESPIRRRYILKIQFAPTVNPMLSSVSAIQDLSATLSCMVSSYPKASVSWYFASEGGASKNSEAPRKVLESGNRIFDLEDTDEENVFNYILKISRVQLSSAGTYYCRAENVVGMSNTSIKLNVEPFPVPKGPDFDASCCEREKVIPECLSACTPEINLQAYENPLCLNEFPKLLTCAKDGIDNRRCCANWGVPESCLSYCNGQILLFDTGTLNLDCANFRSQMVTCVQEGHKYVSDPPEDLCVNVSENGKVNVTWKAPSANNNAIQMYVLYYKKTGEQNYTEVRTDNTNVVIDSLTSNFVYNFTVIAVNHYGFSIFAPLVTKRISTSSDDTDSLGSKLLIPSGSTRNVAGTVLGIIFCLLLGAVVVLLIVYFTRRPYKLPAFILKLGAHAASQANSSSAPTSVAFENPGYDKDGQVRGLPGDNSDAKVYVPTEPGGAVGWETPNLETPEDSPAPEQRGMRYTQLK